MPKCHCQMVSIIVGNGIERQKGLRFKRVAVVLKVGFQGISIERQIQLPLLREGQKGKSSCLLMLLRTGEIRPNLSSPNGPAQQILLQPCFLLSWTTSWEKDSHSYRLWTRNCRYWDATASAPRRLLRSLARQNNRDGRNDANRRRRRPGEGGRGGPDARGEPVASIESDDGRGEPRTCPAMANQNYDVENIDGLIQAYIRPDQRISKKTVKKLPQAGYGSIMLKLDLTLSDENSEEERLHVVAKILPASQMMREMFNIQVTFKNEVAFYDTILPALEKFRNENGVSGILEMFPKFYGARINLGSSEKVDEHAVMVMENLIEAGFKNFNSRIGFDKQGAEFLLADLAKFHATTISLRIKKPKLFEEKIKATCREFFFPETDYEVNSVRYLLKDDPECADCMHLINAYNHRKVPEANTVFAGLAHGDLWVNNTMQRTVDGRVVQNKFIDFQIYNFRSCVSDVFFFVFTSIQLNALKNNVDYFLKFYHKHLVRSLAELNCDTTPFSYENFLEEMRREAYFEFSHSINFAFIIRIPIPEKLDEDSLPKAEEIVTTLPSSVKDHVCYITKECRNRGWTY